MRWKEGALLVSVVVIGVIGAEVLFRAARMGMPPDHPLRPKLADLYTADEHLGYTLWKSTKTCYRYPSFNPVVHPMVSNRWGFRGVREFDEPDDRTRILVVGDSFVQGVGVAREDRFTDRVEREKPEWRVDSMGISGWGLDTMVRAIELYGEKVKPDVVVLALYTDDFRRQHPLYAGLGYHIPKFRLVDGRLETYHFEMPRGLERFARLPRGAPVLLDEEPEHLGAERSAPRSLFRECEAFAVRARRRVHCPARTTTRSTRRAARS